MIATEVDSSMGCVALAWMLTKDGFPIVGTRALAHLKEGLKALDLRLSPDQLQRLNNISAVNLGYPHNLLKTVQKQYDQ